LAELKPKPTQMIKGTGTDIVEIKTIEKSILQNKRFKERVYTSNEIEYCETKPNKFQHYAARFAAKEAVMKALETGWNKGIQWKHIEVLNEPNGKPIIRLTDKANELTKENEINNVHISLSHCENYATAFVVIQ
jgi:holo-[acyl-carrier protein] synthase